MDTTIKTDKSNYENTERARKYDIVLQLFCLKPETIELAMSLCRKRKCSVAEKLALHQFRFAAAKALDQIEPKTRFPELRDLVRKTANDLVDSPIMYPLYLEFGLLVIELESLPLKEALSNYKVRRRLREKPASELLRQAVALDLQELARTIAKGGNGKDH